MDAAAYNRFISVCDRAAKDVEYQKLVHQCADLDLPLLSVMEKLSEEEGQILKAYIRLTGNAALRMLEIACECPQMFAVE